ncbi:MAG: hypothetical protein GY754_14095 [bacterium]|nr:hypothetical protein [bacterium]
MYLLRTLLFLILLAAPPLFFNHLDRFPDPPGTDGYFYLVQIESLAGGQGFYYPDRSLAFFIPAFISKITGDSRFAFHLAITLIWSFLLFITACLSSRISSNLGVPQSTRVTLALLTTLILMCSPNLYELSLNYFKNLCGMSVFITGLFIYAHPERSPGRILAVFLIFIMAIFFHKSMLLFFLLFFFARKEFTDIVTKRPLFIILPVILSISMVFFFENAFKYLFHLFSFFDTPGQRLTWIVSKINFHRLFLIDLVFLITALWVYGISRKQISIQVKPLLDFMALILIITLFPFHQGGPQTPGYRLLLLAPFFSIPLLTISIALRERSFDKFGKICLKLSTIIFLLIMAYAWNGRPVDSSVYFPEWRGLHRSIQIMKKYAHEDDILVTHHGLKFYITYATGFKTTEYKPWKPYRKIYRLAYLPEGRPSGEEREKLRAVELMAVGKEYALFMEEDWLRVSKKINLKPHWKNPSKEKPGFMY